ncbi:MAG: GGDEF domain-containing protein [Bryobacterales bacterium]|nr:GGDEF domain-containing protein [Bryobacterales bacterium]
MISLKKTLDELEQADLRFRTCLHCYVAALQSIDRHAVPSREDLLGEYRDVLRRLRRRLLEQPDIETIQQSAISLDAALEDYCRKSSAVWRDREAEIKKILALVAEAADTLGTRAEACSADLRNAARQLEEAARLDDLPAIRRKLADGIRQIKRCAEEMQREHQASAAQLRQELKAFRERLAQAEVLAVTDPLTGLANRRAAEKRIEENIRVGQRFCLVLFDLDDFKSINDHYGHQAGDLVLKFFGQRLAEQFRPEDLVCRWGGDEFLVVFSSTQEDAQARLQGVQARAAGCYAFKLAGREVVIQVRATAGIAEHIPGESIEELFARADAFLYERKVARNGR